MLIGDAHVSTRDQNLDLQHTALTKVGCQKVFEDKASGMRADQPGLARTLEMLHDGQTPAAFADGGGSEKVRSMLSAIRHGSVV